MEDIFVGSVQNNLQTFYVSGWTWNEGEPFMTANVCMNSPGYPFIFKIDEAFNLFWQRFFDEKRFSSVSYITKPLTDSGDGTNIHSTYEPYLIIYLEAIDATKNKILKLDSTSGETLSEVVVGEYKPISQYAFKAIIFGGEPVEVVYSTHSGTSSKIHSFSFKLDDSAWIFKTMDLEGSASFSKDGYKFIEIIEQIFYVGGTWQDNRVPCV